MHEMGMVQFVFDTVRQTAEQHGAKRVNAVVIQAGALRGIVEQYMNFYWEMLAKDTDYADTKIVIEKIPVRLRCRDCGREFEPPEGEVFDCGDCKTKNVEAIRGTELIIKEIQVE